MEFYEQLQALQCEKATPWPFPSKENDSDLSVSYKRHEEFGLYLRTTAKLLKNAQHT